MNSPFEDTVAQRFADWNYGLLTIISSTLKCAMKFIQLLGKQFGRLTVERHLGRNKHGANLWLCECACGNKKNAITSRLIGGRIKSCGCLLKEMLPKIRLRHGSARRGKVSPEYSAWASAISRCSCGPEDKNFKRYAGRGISFYGPWRNSFEEFLKHVGTKPTPSHSLDRFPDVDGNYEPGNVRWATPKEQCETRTKSYTLIEFGEQSMCISDWEKKLGFPPGVVEQRLRVLGWDVEKALTTKPRKLPKRSSCHSSRQ